MLDRKYSFLHIVAAGMSAIVIANEGFIWVGLAMSLISFSIAEIITIVVGEWS